MKPEVLEALEGSICKWDLICQGIGTNQGSDNCPLCQIFNPRLDCDGCPVALKTGEESCEGSPYYAAVSEGDAPLGKLLEYHGPSFWLYGVIESSEAELIFLLELLPEGHRWRDQI